MEIIVSYPRMVAAHKKKRVKEWILRDTSLTNEQLRELLDVSDHVITDVRKELSIPSPSKTIPKSQVNKAFEKVVGKKFDKKKWNSM